MDPQKREIIIREIEHWRRSRLLPEQYCNFLLNLYKNPDDRDEQPVDKRSGGAPLRVLPGGLKLWLPGIVGLLIISLIILNFNSFHISMQIGISSIIILICYLLGVLKRNSHPLLSYSAFGAGSVIMLVLGIYMLRLHGLDTVGYVLGFIGFCSIVWLAIGLAGQMPIFHFCGWAGAALLYAWTLYRYLADYSWLNAQIYWLPLCFLFGLVGWLVLQRSKPNSKVLIIMACLMWFMPEIFLLVADGYGDGYTYSLIGKTAVSAIVFAALRKKWTEWVL